MQSRKEGLTSRALRVMDEVRGDARYAARTLWRSPGFTVASVLTLALGIGATAAVVDVADQIFFRPLPLHEPDRLVEISSRLNPQVTMSFVMEDHFEALRTGTQHLQGIAGSKSVAVRADGTASSRTRALFVTADYFRVLGVAPAAGRSFDAEEYATSQPVAVASASFWRSRFGPEPFSPGATVQVDGQPVVIVGVMAPGFIIRRAGVERPDLWLPEPVLATLQPSLRSPALNVTARLAPGVTRRQAEAELSALIRNAGGKVRMQGVELVGLAPVAEAERGRVLRGVSLLGLAAALLLLLAVLNVSGLMLARSTVRRHELGVRMAMGASRARISRQLVTEGAVLFLLGGTFAVLVSRGLTTLFATLPWPVPVHLDPGMRMSVLATGLGVATLSGMAAGLLPALHAARHGPAPVIGRDSANRRSGRVRTVAVAMQLAVSLVLLVGASLFLRALQQAWNLDLGYDPARVATAALVERTGGRAPTATELDALLENVRAVPGITGAALTSAAPAYSDATTITLSPTVEALGLPFATAPQVVTPGYFGTMGITLLNGRDFTSRDDAGAERVAIVSRSLAERLWPGDAVAGRRLGSGPGSVEVVGIAADVRTGSLREAPTPALYLPARQEATLPPRLLVVAAENATALRTARQRAADASPALAELHFESLGARVAGVLAPQRMGVAILGGLALFGLLLAALGLYGILAYAVATRTREVGVRMALGARRGDVLRHFLLQGIRVSVAGAALGIGVAAALARLIAGMLYGVTPLDPLAYAMAAATLLAVAAAASLIPSLRAARLEPMTTLRAD